MQYLERLYVILMIYNYFYIFVKKQNKFQGKFRNTTNHLWFMENN